MPTLQRWESTMILSRNGPTRDPTYNQCCTVIREIPDKCTLCFTNWYRMLHSWLGSASTWEGYPMPTLQRWESTMILSRNGPTGDPTYNQCCTVIREIPDKCTVCFTNWYRMLHSWLGAASTWEGYLMPTLERC